MSDWIRPGSPGPSSPTPATAHGAGALPLSFSLPSAAERALAWGVPVNVQSLPELPIDQLYAYNLSLTNQSVRSWLPPAERIVGAQRTDLVGVAQQVDEGAIEDLVAIQRAYPGAFRKTRDVPGMTKILEGYRATTMISGTADALSADARLGSQILGNTLTRTAAEVNAELQEDADDGNAEARSAISLLKSRKDRRDKGRDGVKGRVDKAFEKGQATPRPALTLEEALLRIAVLEERDASMSQELTRLRAQLPPSPPSNRANPR